MDEMITARIREAVIRGDRESTLEALRALSPEREPNDTGNLPADDQVLVTLSLIELLQLIDLVTRPKSFGEALREIGFEPVKGARLAPREPHPMRRGPLPRRPKDD